MADDDRLSAELAAIREREQAATPAPWGDDDNEDHWQLFGALTDCTHPLQLIKAPKQGTPYAEYCRTRLTLRSSSTPAQMFPVSLAALGTVLAKHRPEDSEPCCRECGFTWPCPTVRDITGALTGEG